MENLNIEDATQPSAPQDLLSVISRSLDGEDSNEISETLERLKSEAANLISEGKRYIDQNPQEATALAISAGLAAWALFFTKPGRQAFDTGIALAGPELTKKLGALFKS